MAGRLPDFIIIGAMKCGTSTLHEQLALRPGVFMSDPKEPNFFSDDPVWSRGLDWYTALFAAARPDQVCGESSTHYTKLPTWPRTVARLRQHVPQARLVYLMRDPLARLASQYIHEWSQREVRGTFETAVRRHERYIAYSCYARQLEPFLESYGPDRVLPVFFERMLARPDEELARVCAFVGDPSPEPARWQAGVGAQNVSRERMRKSRLRAVLLAMPGVRPLVDRIPEGPRERIKSLWRMEQRPRLPETLRREVEARLDEDIGRLGAWLGRPLSCSQWKQQVVNGPLGWVAPPLPGR